MWFFSVLILSHLSQLCECPPITIARQSFIAHPLCFVFLHLLSATSSHTFCATLYQRCSPIFNSSLCPSICPSICPALVVSFLSQFSLLTAFVSTRLQRLHPHNPTPSSHSCPFFVLPSSLDNGIVPFQLQHCRSQIL